jgi:hypothetical protein
LIFSEEIIENGNMPILKPRAITLFYFFRISFKAAHQHKKNRALPSRRAGGSGFGSHRQPLQNRAAARFVIPGGSTSGLTHSSAAKRRFRIPR